MGQTSKIILAVVFGVFAIFVMLAIAGRPSGPPGETVAERIERECRSAYSTQDEVNRCILAVGAQVLRDAQSEKIKSVYDQVR